MYIEALGNATMHQGVIRIEARIRGGDNKEQVAGHLIIPAQFAGQVATQLNKILRELKKKIDEQAAAQKAADAKPVQ